MDSRNDTLAGGLPHSDIHGSKPARGSPWLFAACHVLHRLLVPRHPPNALIILRSSGQMAVFSFQSPVVKDNRRLTADDRDHPPTRISIHFGTEPGSSSVP